MLKPLNISDACQMHRYNKECVCYWPTFTVCALRRKWRIFQHSLSCLVYPVQFRREHHCRTTVGSSEMHIDIYTQHKYANIPLAIRRSGAGKLVGRFIIRTSFPSWGFATKQKDTIISILVTKYQPLRFIRTSYTKEVIYVVALENCT